MRILQIEDAGKVSNCLIHKFQTSDHQCIALGSGKASQDFESPLSLSQPYPVDARMKPPPTDAAVPPYLGARRRWQRVLLIVLAVVSLGLAVVGVFVPGLPSTEFVLLAAWAAARSSPRLHAWLHRHRWFGPMLYNWRNGRRVSRASKYAATVSMTLCVVIMHATIPHPWFVWSAAVCMVVVLLWLWRRPETTRAKPSG